MDFHPETRFPVSCVGETCKVAADNGFGDLLTLNFEQMRCRGCVRGPSHTGQIPGPAPDGGRGRRHILGSDLIAEGASQTLPWPPGFAPWGRDALLVVLYRDLAGEESRGPAPISWPILGRHLARIFRGRPRPSGPDPPEPNPPRPPARSAASAKIQRPLAARGPRQNNKQSTHRTRNGPPGKAATPERANPMVKRADRCDPDGSNRFPTPRGRHPGDNRTLPHA